MVRAIARTLQRSPSTISRELKRCGWQSQAPVPSVRLRTRGINGYWCESAQKRACALASKPRTVASAGDLSATGEVALSPGRALSGKLLVTLAGDGLPGAALAVPLELGGTLDRPQLTLSRAALLGPALEGALGKSGSGADGSGARLGERARQALRRLFGK